uniref:Microfibril-associated glycoprotein 4-like n=1 Tax=Sinocyclocheilus rhinocerous TaxID=307959 RepID=A0A673J6C9_9TELE
RTFRHLYNLKNRPMKIECRHDEEMLVDCSEIYKSGQTLGGIYTIYPTSDIPVRVNCHMISCGSDEDSGGWTVIQRRMDGSVNFYQPWKEYKRGFGNVEGEYWLGLENIYQLTRKRKYVLRVDMEDFEGNKVFALYSSFSVDCETDGYQLHVSGFTDGGAGDSLSTHNDQKFSTFDKDQDPWAYNCAKYHLGGFWYNSCHNANPNGLYLWTEASPHSTIGVVWLTWKENSMKSIIMKIKHVI